MPETPTWAKPCETCQTPIERWRGQAEVTCPNCGTCYNAGGTRLRAPMSLDEHTDDATAYEIAMLRADMARATA